MVSCESISQRSTTRRIYIASSRSLGLPDALGLWRQPQDRSMRIGRIDAASMRQSQEAAEELS
ncbi:MULTISPECIES: hypothetical protein [Paenibacillus]|uniref:Uncharacterized protein n=1 Tax=Paenibacillus ottowii TaxID=2315729 RepID=A0ABY3AXW9_9BACL|nr:MULTISPECIES: hypothetical protein [Paenibacillus]MDY8119815.1 hypothetical protein [Paenibacillus polymyxa]TQR92839.1 hypothetical protein FKV70_25220 [Paenibacillus ottowii]